MGITFTSPLLYFILMPILILFSMFLVSKLDFYKKVIDGEDRGKFESLDGLRGFLALNVFFQHAVTTYFYFQNGIWQIVPVKFYRFLGGEAVILFFIMTSFLYWSKAIAQKGDLDAGSLYRSRFLRLVPMYLFTGVIIFFSIFIQSGFNIDIVQTAKDVLSWSSLGLVTTTTVNNISLIPINAGIHWTLSFEWFFYLLLPILAIAIKRKENLIMALPIAFFALSSPDRGYWAIFFFGIIAAHIYVWIPKMKFFSRPIFSLIPLLGIVLVYYMNYKPFSFSQYAVSLFVFLAFVYGADFFGLLRTRVVKFLGIMSYSIYLVHGIVLYAVFNTLDYYYPVTQLTPVNFWLFVTLAGFLTICVSALTYRYIEHPFILRIKSKKPETNQTTITDQVM
ncbi:MAG: acyltransferase [Candidatus Zambryskibacteria bacterium]|nr:acyltransferase [Candidatus Zambryskibacteria bacterium]